MHARADAPPENANSWPDDIFSVLQRFDVRQVPYVPDAGHSQLIERVLATPAMRAVPLTTEEEGVALIAGAWGGGQRAVLLMQSSGSAGNRQLHRTLVDVPLPPHRRVAGLLVAEDDGRRVRTRRRQGAEGVYARRSP